ncbi:MAG: thiamine-phosphate kinase [Gammaproteobacteria bacterium]|nr:thiamine-phosphate kinase [Gammaproteobacteria bacterium]
MAGGADASGADATIGEFELIDRYFRRAGAADGSVVVGIGDDAAVLRLPPEADLVAAVDTIVEGRHFPTHSPPRSIGHRALAVNLSDLAAMGATPAWATLALTLPTAQPAWLEEFAAGLLDLAGRHQVALVGGDTTSGPLTVSLQILGFVPRGTALLRRGASVGDLIAVSGTLGDAAAGLAALTAPQAAAGEESLWLRQRFEYPTPRVELGLAARGIASAAMDLSDGLIGDLPKMAAASGLEAHVELEALPLSKALRLAYEEGRACELALCGGDDYELLFAVPPARWSALHAAAVNCGTTLTAIGEFSAGRGVRWRRHGRPHEPVGRGFDHFARASTQVTV